MSNLQIFLRDPWRVVIENDTGFGNRLMCWDLASYFREILGNKHDIVTLECEYPELHVVDLPHTKTISNPPILEPISDYMIEKWIKTGECPLDPNKSYETDFSFDSNVFLSRYIFKSVTSQTYMKDITIKHPELKKAISNFTKNMIGIHIRRGNGVYYTDKDYKSIPSSYKKYYTPCYNCDTSYQFIRDDYFYSLIEETLSVNPQAKFYFSIDVDENSLNYYKEKYPGKIFTCMDFTYEYKDIVKESKVLDKKCDISNLGNNILDFFLLSSSRFILQSRNSTWSMLAYLISNNTTSFSDLKVEQVVKSYIENKSTF